MPRGPAPSWRARKEPVLDAYILASVEKAGGLGKHHPETGHYATLVIKGLASRDEADEYSRALYRCAHYLNRTGQLPVGMSAKIKRAGNRYEIEFRAVDKTLARAHVMAKYGPDRSKWPYDPRRRGGNP
jgi:hypothetical protein